MRHVFVNRLHLSIEHICIPSSSYQCQIGAAAGLFFQYATNTRGIFLKEIRNMRLDVRPLRRHIRFENNIAFVEQHKFFCDIFMIQVLIQNIAKRAQRNEEKVVFLLSGT